MAIYGGALYSGEKLVSDCDLVKKGGNNITRMYVGECLIYPSKTHSSLLQYSGSSSTDVCRQVNPPLSNMYWVDCSTLDVGDYVWSNPTKTVFIKNGYYGSGNGSSNFYYIIDGVVSSIGTCPPVYTYHRYRYGWTSGNTNSCFLNQSTVTLVYSYIFKDNGFYEILDNNEGMIKYYLLAVPHSTRNINIDNYASTGGDCAPINGYDPHWVSLLDNNQITKKTCYNGVLNNVSIDDNPFSETYGKYLLSNGVILNTQPIFSVGPCTTATPTPTAATPTPTAATPTPTPTSTVATPTPTSTQYYLLEKCADTNIQDRSIMNIPNLGDGTVVKLSDDQCYTIIGRSTLETTNTITDYNYSNNCNSCRGITPPTPTPIIYYYDLFRCDNEGGDRSVMNVSGLANGTVVELNDGKCYTITGTSTAFTTNTINRTHNNCNSCRGITPPTPTPVVDTNSYYKVIECDSGEIKFWMTPYALSVDGLRKIFTAQGTITCHNVIEKLSSAPPTINYSFYNIRIDYYGNCNYCLNPSSWTEYEGYEGCYDYSENINRKLIYKSTIDNKWSLTADSNNLFGGIFVFDNGYHFILNGITQYEGVCD